MAPRSPTLQDIANAASVGKATVSLALRNDPRLRPETRERIQKIAAEMGYRANATVAALMAQLRTSRTPKYQATLAFINASEERATDKTFPSAWTVGSLRRAAQLGYGLDHFWLREPGITPARLGSIIESRCIRGLVIAGVTDRRRLPAGFEEIWTRLPSVVLGFRPTDPALHSASNDQFATSLQAVEEVLTLGYQRPGLVVEPAADARVDHRFSAGFWVGQRKLPPGRRLPVCGFQRGRPGDFAAWFIKHQPDVILCLHEEVKSWLAAEKVRVPRDVGLVHLDRTATMGGWAGMNQSNDLVGVAAIDMIVGQIHRNETGIPPVPRAMMIGSSWVPGDTVRARP